MVALILPFHRRSATERERERERERVCVFNSQFIVNGPHKVVFFYKNTKYPFSLKMKKLKSYFYFLYSNSFFFFFFFLILKMKTGYKFVNQTNFL